MEAHRYPLVLLLLAAAALPATARAESVAPKPSLEDRVTALEDELRESRALIQEQRQIIQKQNETQDIDVGEGTALDPFFQGLSIGGHIAASYGYSFNNPAVNAGANTLCSFQCNHNELSIDAAKLEIGRAASEPGKVGFELDVLFGQNANIQGTLATLGAPADGDSTPNGASSDQEFYLQQAFASYNANGIELKLGKFETLLGYELYDTDANANITQGVLFTFAIPAFHTGLLAGGSFSEDLTWNAGFVNGFNNTREQGDAKAFMGRLGWTHGNALVALSTFIGTLGETRMTQSGLTVGDNKRDTQIYDLILEYKFTDGFKSWANIDVGRTDPATGDAPKFYGIALGSKVQLSDKLYLAVRGEYMRDKEGSRFGPLGNLVGALGPAPFDDIDVFTGTLTLGYQIGPGLLARLEYRHDDVDCDDTDCMFFPDNNSPPGPGGEDTNDLALFEVVYSFD